MAVVVQSLLGGCDSKEPVHPHELTHHPVERPLCRCPFPHEVEDELMGVPGEHLVGKDDLAHHHIGLVAAERGV